MKKLSQIEYELTKGLKDTQIQALITSCRNEKSMFLEEIETAKKTNGQFNTSKRKLFANAITWNSTLYEQTLRIQNNKKVHHTRNPSWKGSGDDFIKIDNTNTSNTSTTNNTPQNNYLTLNEDFKENVFDDTPIISTTPSSSNIIMPSSFDKQQQQISTVTTTTTTPATSSVSTNTTSSSSNSATPISTTIINAFTNLMGNSTSIAQPLLFPSGYNDTVVLVYEDEPSSIIAHTLTSKEYTEKLGIKEKQELNSPSLEALDGKQKIQFNSFLQLNKIGNHCWYLRNLVI